MGYNPHHSASVQPTDKQLPLGKAVPTAPRLMASDSHYPRSQLACQRRHPTHHSQLTSVLQPTNLLLSVFMQPIWSLTAELGGVLFDVLA